MITITARLREHLAKEHGLADEATDEYVRGLIGRLLSSDQLSVKTIRELTQPAARITSFGEAYITPGMHRVLVEHFRMAKSADKSQAADFLFKCYERGQLDIPTIRDIVKQSPDSFLSDNEGNAMTATATNDKAASTISASDLLATAAGGNGGANIRVKDASEMYCDKKSVGKHAKYDRPVRDEQGVEVMLPSQREFAKCAVHIKARAARAGIEGCRLTEHEQSLYAEMVEKDTWLDFGANDGCERISGLRLKTLLNETGGSGGSHAVPEVFDSVLITFPLLHSELLPLVDLRPLSRGSQVAAASIGNPELSWGVAEGTSVPLFDTAGLIADIDTAIHSLACAVEVGREFLSDSPADIGSQLMQLAGESLLKEIDRVIAVGNGTTEPSGIEGTSGIVRVPVAVDVNSPEIADFEALAFGLEKQYRAAGMRCTFIGTDDQYALARAIAVGSDDQRRVFGMDEQSYRLLEFPYKVAPSFAQYCAFGALSRYRLYRRQGATTEWTTGGKSLSRTNTALMTIRSRWGGRVVDANAFSIWVDEESSSS